MKMTSLEIENILYSAQSQKKRTRGGILALLGSLCISTDEATTETTKLLLLLDVTIPYFHFPATTRFYLR